MDAHTKAFRREVADDIVALTLALNDTVGYCPSAFSDKELAAVRVMVRHAMALADAFNVRTDTAGPEDGSNVVQFRPRMKGT